MSCRTLLAVSALLVLTSSSTSYIADPFAFEKHILSLFHEVQEFLTFLKDGYQLDDVRLACTQADGVRVMGAPRFQVSPYYERPMLKVSGPCRQNIQIEASFYVSNLRLTIDKLTRGSRSAPANFTARTLAIKVSASVMDAPDLIRCSSKFRIFNVTRFDGVAASSPEPYYHGPQLGEYDTWNDFFAHLVVPYLNQQLEKYNALVAIDSCIKLCPDVFFNKENCLKSNKT